MNPFRLQPWLYALAAALGVVAVYFIWPTDLRRVEKNTRAFFSAMSKSGPESLPVAAARSLEAGSYLAGSLDIQLGKPFPPRLSKSEFIQLLQRGRMTADRLRIKNQGHHVYRQNGEIWMDVTMDVLLEYRGSKESMLGTYRLVWVDQDDQWVMVRVEAIEVITHPNGIGLIY